MKIMQDTSCYVGFKRSEAAVVDVILRTDLILFSPVAMKS